MPTYPANVATVVVTGNWGPDATGLVTFAPSAILADGTSSQPQFVLPKPVSAVLACGGISVELMATDDSHLSPSGWLWVVTEQIVGQPTRTYYLQLPKSAPTIDLTAATKPVTQTLVGYVEAAAVGAVNGVVSAATLTTKGDMFVATAQGTVTREAVGADGQVLTADSTSPTGVSWQAGGGGGGGGTPSSTVTSETSYGQASSAGTATTYSKGDHTHGTPAAPTLAGLGGVPTSRTISTTAPLTGGGDLSADRALSVSDATTGTKGVVQLAGDLAGTAAAPTVPGLAGKVPTSRQVLAGTGLTGGGDLTADRTLAVAYGTTAGTAAQGNDSRIVGALQASNNLSDLVSAVLARANLGVYVFDAPSRHGLVEWNYPLDLTGSSAGVAAVGGTIYAIRIDCQAGQPVSNIDVACGTAASGLTAGQCQATVINSSGTEVARNGDISGLFASTGLVSIPVPSFTPTAGQPYVVLLLFNGTTPPNLVRSSATSNIAPNAGLTATSPRRYFTAGTGQTAIPSSVTLSGTTATGAFTYWAGLS